MSIKKITIVGIIFIFLLSFITHNIYDWFPSFLSSLFFPVNESIWEHQKMIFSTTLIWGLIEFFLLKKYSLDYTNIVASTVLSALFNIIIFLVIYTPIYIGYGHNLIVTLIIYFITITISQMLGSFILQSKWHRKTLKVVSIILIPLSFLIFGHLTYYPLHIEALFYDNDNSTYGINN